MAETLPKTLVKLCGTTSFQDAQWAIDCGADYIGVIVNYPPSPRHVSLEDAVAMRRRLPAQTRLAAVTVNLLLDDLRRVHDKLQPDVFQLHGDETPELVAALKSEGARVWAAVHNAERAAQMREAEVEAILVDARATAKEKIIYGGTGQRSDWKLARELGQQGVKVVLAGGLNEQNVREAIEQVQPWMVDTISGVEARKGVKDPQKVADFIKAVRGK